MSRPRTCISPRLRVREREAGTHPRGLSSGYFQGALFLLGTEAVVLPGGQGYQFQLSSFQRPQDPGGAEMGRDIRLSETRYGSNGRVSRKASPCRRIPRCACRAAHRVRVGNTCQVYAISTGICRFTPDLSTKLFDLVIIYIRWGEGILLLGMHSIIIG